jgi:thiol-disulfide isomerase/thioredoxin
MIMVTSQIRVIEVQDFSELFSKDGGIKVVGFFETNSGTCEMMLPVFESASIEFSEKVLFFRMDVIDLDAFMTEYHIQRKPFFLIIKGDQITDSMAGLVPSSRFFRIIQTHID